jgi:hypothetical protein
VSSYHAGVHVVILVLVLVYVARASKICPSNVVVVDVVVNAVFDADGGSSKALPLLCFPAFRRRNAYSESCSIA